MRTADIHDPALESALLLCEARGWARVFIPHSAGSVFPRGHHQIFYKPSNGPNSGGTRMARTVEEVLSLLENNI